MRKTSLSRWVCWFDQSSKRDCAGAILRIWFIVQTFISFSWGVCSNVCSAKLHELESQTANTRCIQKMTERIMKRLRHQNLTIVRYYCLTSMGWKYSSRRLQETECSCKFSSTIPHFTQTWVHSTCVHICSVPATHRERESGREKAKLHKPHMLNFMLSANHLKASSMCVLSRRDALMHNSWRDRTV